MSFSRAATGAAFLGLLLVPLLARAQAAPPPQTILPPVTVTAGRGTDLEKLRDQYQRQLQETKDLVDQMRRDDPSFARGAGGGFTFEGADRMTLSAPGTEAFKQDFAKWEDLRRQATQALESVASSLSRKLQAKQAKDRLAAGTDDKPPAGYQKQVDSYFKAIASKKKP